MSDKFINIHSIVQESHFSDSGTSAAIDLSAQRN